MATSNCLVDKIIQNIFFYDTKHKHKKETHTGLEQLERSVRW